MTDFRTKDLVVEQGKLGVRIEAGWAPGDVTVYTTRNGFQWTGFEAPRELLVMLRDAINKHLDCD